MFQVKYDGQLRTEQDVHSLACDVHCVRVQKSNSGANKIMKWTDGGYHGSRYFMVVEIINQNKFSGRWQVAEWVVRDAAFGQGEVVNRPSQLVSYFVYISKRNSRAASQGKTAQ